MAQIGTIRVDTQNNGTVDVPVFETGDSSSDIYEFVRVETASGTGFIPVTDTGNAAYPYLRVQSQNNGIVAITDTKGSTIPDSGVSRWRFEDSSETTTAVDGWGSNNLDIVGGTYDNDSAVEGYTLFLDGVDDQLNSPDSLINPDNSFSFSIWIKANQTFYQSDILLDQDGQRHVVSISISNTNPDQLEARVIESGYDTTSTAHYNFTDTSGYHMVTLSYSPSDGLDFYLDKTNNPDGNDAANAEGTDVPFVIGASQTGGKNNFDGRIDDPRIYNKALSSEEVSNLYETGSISG